MEALAAGTPVVAFPSGAIPEIVEDGITGFLIHDEKQMAAAIERCGKIDPRACRKRAKESFSQSRMVQEYLALYERIACDRAQTMESCNAAG